MPLTIIMQLTKPLSGAVIDEADLLADNFDLRHEWLKQLIETAAHARRAGQPYLPVMWGDREAYRITL